MLRHLQSRLREEFGHDLQFYYPPGDVQMVIMRDGEDGAQPVSVNEQTAIVNRAWQLARELVRAHMVRRDGDCFNF